MSSLASFALLAVVAAAGATALAHGQIVPECINCTIDELREQADAALLGDIPISIRADADGYGHSDTIMITGKVSNMHPDFPVTIKVTSPLNSLVSIDQIDAADIAEDGTFAATLNTAGALWKYDGLYIIQASYGSASDKLRVNLTGGVAYEPRFATPDRDAGCSDDELVASGHCVPYTITGGEVTGASINTKDKSIVIEIDTADGGVLVINPSMSVQDGIFTVLVDGEEWNEAEIDGNEVTVMFPPGAEVIEVIGTFVIPEFGIIAVLVLAVAVISVVAISSRSRLGIVMPRY